MNEDYIVREFQKIFIIPYNDSINKLKSIDDEVKGFIEFSIDDCIDLFLKLKKSILGTTNQMKEINVTLDNFVEAYLKGDELYLRLVIASKRYTRGDRLELIKW